MGEDLEQCVKKVEIAVARVEEQVKPLKQAIDETKDELKSLISRFFDSLSDIYEEERGLETHLNKIESSGCAAGDVDKNKCTIRDLSKRVMALEQKPKTSPIPTPARFWALLWLAAGLLLGSMGQSIGPPLAAILGKWLGQ